MKVTVLNNIPIEKNPEFETWVRVTQRHTRQQRRNILNKTSDSQKTTKTKEWHAHKNIFLLWLSAGL